MKKIIITLFICFLTTACSTSKIIHPVCRHKALYCALSAKEQGFDAYISFGPITKKEKVLWHAQAKVKENGKDIWLYMRNDGRCEGGIKDNFEDMNELTVDRYIELFLLHK